MPPPSRYHSPLQAASRAVVQEARRIAVAAMPERSPSHRQPPPTRRAPAPLPRRARRQACGAAHAAPPRHRADARRLHRRRGAGVVPGQRPRAVGAPGAVRGHKALLRPQEHLLRARRRVLARRTPRVHVGAPRRAAGARAPRRPGARGRRARLGRGGCVCRRRLSRQPERHGRRHQQQHRAARCLRRRRRRRQHGRQGCPRREPGSSWWSLGRRLRAVAPMGGHPQRHEAAAGAAVPPARRALRARHRRPHQQTQAWLRGGRRLGRCAPPPPRRSGSPEHVRQPQPHQRHSHGHVHCRERHVGGDGAVGDDGARQEPGRARQGAARGAPRRRRRRRRRRQGRCHGAGSRPPGSPLPEAGHQGDPAAAPGGAAAGAPGDDGAVQHGARRRDTGQDARRHQRDGDTHGPRRLGSGRGAVRARAPRRRRRRRQAARRVRAGAVRDRAEELPRRALRGGGGGAAAGQPALLLRLARTAGPRGGRGGGERAGGAQEEPSRAHRLQEEHRFVMTMQAILPASTCKTLLESV